MIRVCVISTYSKTPDLCFCNLNDQKDPNHTGDCVFNPLLTCWESPSRAGHHTTTPYHHHTKDESADSFPMQMVSSSRAARVQVLTCQNQLPTNWDKGLGISGSCQCLTIKTFADITNIQKYAKKTVWVYVMRHFLIE